MIKRITSKTYSEERALYNLKNARLLLCKFMGENDGESPLKEASNISVNSCKFYLRYPLWHVNDAQIRATLFAEPSRAPMWYSKNLVFRNSTIESVKAFRECENITLDNLVMKSAEAIWRCNKVNIVNSDLDSTYLCFESKDINMSKTNFKGKYSFQYVENAIIEDCTLDTKDFLWHANNVTIKNCTIKGEYLGWYSDNLTFINCKIIGTQPLCYCKHLKLIDCEMENCDLSFEFSFVEATINSSIDSIKNPIGGKIVCKSVGEKIRKQRKYVGHCEIIETDKIKENKKAK